MFGLGKHGPDGKYAIILDIGSASVGAAIVASDAVTDENPFIYSCREFALLRDANTDNPTHAIEEALMQVFLHLSGEGLKFLSGYDSKAVISHIQTTICAPWAHTISQQAEYTDDKPFRVTNAVIESLVLNAQKAADKSLERASELKDQGLEVITNKTLHITANGYTVADPRGLETEKLYISHAIGIAPTNIMDAVAELRDKIFPSAQLDSYTFMLVFYSALRDMFPNSTEACLIDITGEATEIGVVRNHELTRVKHTTFGHQTIARILNDKLNLPEGMADTIMCGNATELTSKQQIVLDSVVQEYIDELVVMIQSLGTTLTIPKPLFIHCDKRHEEFFIKHVRKAAEAATHITHMTTPITSRLYTKSQSQDTALYLSGYFFHKLHKQNGLHWPN